MKMSFMKSYLVFNYDGLGLRENLVYSKNLIYFLYRCLFLFNFTMRD